MSWRGRTSGEQRAPRGHGSGGDPRRASTGGLPGFPATLDRVARRRSRSRARRDHGSDRASPIPTDAVHVPDDVAVVAIASNRPDRPAWVRAAFRAGASVVSTDDDELGELDATARAANATVDRRLRVGAGVERRPRAARGRRVHERSTKCMSRASGRRVLRASRRCATRAGRRRASGATAAGAPTARSDPSWCGSPSRSARASASSCREGVTAIVTTVPTARHATVRYGAPPTHPPVRLPPPPRSARRRMGRDPRRGHRHASRDARDRSCTASSIACRSWRARCWRWPRSSSPGSVPTPGRGRVGVRALGEVVTPVPFLTELAHRGVKAAAFVGVAPAA